MRNKTIHKIILSLSILCAASSIYSADAQSRTELEHQYAHTSSEQSDINEHVPVLRELASQCATVVELGLRGMNSTWGILMGLADSAASMRFYTGVDIAPPVP